MWRGYFTNPWGTLRSPRIFYKSREYIEKYLRLEEVFLLLLLIELFLSKVGKQIMQTHYKIYLPSYLHILAKKIGENVW